MYSSYWGCSRMMPCFLSPLSTSYLVRSLQKYLLHIDDLQNMHISSRNTLNLCWMLQGWVGPGVFLWHASQFSTRFISLSSLFFTTHSLVISPILTSTSNHPSAIPPSPRFRVTSQLPANPIHLISFSSLPNNSKLHPSQLMKKLKLREVKMLSEDETSCKRQSWSVGSLPSLCSWGICWGDLSMTPGSPY